MKCWSEQPALLQVVGLGSRNVHCLHLPLYPVVVQVGMGRGGGGGMRSAPTMIQFWRQAFPVG